MSVDENVLLLQSKVNLVQFEKPILIANINQTKQNKSSVKNNVRPVESGDDVDECERQSCDDVLNRILPPKEWEKDGKTFRQCLSHKPATGIHVKKLSEKFDIYLREYNAKEVGICPIKQELYGQCFNELIRQVTLNCTERGYMLIQIRDEIQMTIDAYKELYESVLANGIRKLLWREHKKSDLSTKVEQLISENENLEIELAEINLMTEKLEQDAAEQRNAAIKHQTEEIASLKKSNQLIKVQLESIISPKRV
ncbi:33 kDa inner dynein arm light chain, axonemal-like [Melanaphis sacchari]|uniref:33 kDa inner dynein arm light chain, axonemal-like n=1 Tax=Melanaphis sacchari TaxID=742174 RepID=UPI000DC1317D|nr:33 kDa inner dynein arm light chain, axonemal-like [Melanaphis sacchari]